MAKKEIKKFTTIINRKAEYEFQFVSHFEAGMILEGTEVKSIRAGHTNLKEAFCYMQKGELFIRNMYIGEYKFAASNNHDPRRVRKLLLKKAELKKLNRKVSEKGFTIVPYRLFLSERGFIKLEVVLAQGKRQYDKRNTIKDRQNKRDLDRIKKMNL